MASNAWTTAHLLHLLAIIFTLVTSGASCSAEMCATPAIEDMDISLLQVNVDLTAGALDISEMQAVSDAVSDAAVHDKLSSTVGAANYTAADQLNNNAAFDSFLEKHARTYTQGSPDYEWRQKLFAKRAADAIRHNSKAERLWTAGVNKLADRSDEELSALLGWSGSARPGALGDAEDMAPFFLQVDEVSTIHSWGRDGKPLPEDVGWGYLNSTQHVHNQGDCGSCWAVATVGVLQAHSEIHAPQNAKPLSVQELVSCVPNPRQCGGNGGCDGATAELAMDYVMRHGLRATIEPEEATTESADPRLKFFECPSPAPSDAPTSLSLLAGLVSSPVQLDIAAPGVHPGVPTSLLQSRSLGMHAWERLPPNSARPIMQALVQRGPVTASVFASNWFAYANGIYDGCEKDAVINHAVALIGYGRDHALGAKYWQIQNSWGPEWGENGRIRLLRRDDEETSHCGIDKQPSEGTGCEGGPAEVKVCGMCGVLYDVVVPHF